MNLALQAEEERLERLEGQLKYTNDILICSFTLEPWEEKEYKEIKAEYEEEIKKLKEHIKKCKGLR